MTRAEFLLARIAEEANGRHRMAMDWVLEQMTAAYSNHPDNPDNPDSP